MASYGSRGGQNHSRSGGARQRGGESSVPKNEITFSQHVKGDQGTKLKLTNDSSKLPEKAPAKGSPVVLKSS